MLSVKPDIVIAQQTCTDMHIHQETTVSDHTHKRFNCTQRTTQPLLIRPAECMEDTFNYYGWHWLRPQSSLYTNIT